MLVSFLRLWLPLLLPLVLAAAQSGSSEAEDAAPSMIPTTQPPNASFVNHCHELVGNATKIPCSGDAIFQLGAVNMTNAALNNFCANTSCIRKLDALIKARNECSHIEFSEFYEMSSMDGWPQFEGICSDTCRSSYVTFGQNWYSCQKLNEQVPATFANACKGCVLVNESTSSVDFVAGCGGDGTHIHAMLAEYHLSTLNRSFTMDRYISVCQKYANETVTPQPVVKQPSSTTSSLLLVLIILGGLAAFALVVCCFRRWRRDEPAVDMNRLLTRTSGARSGATTRTGSAPTPDGRTSEELLDAADVEFLERLRVDEASVSRVRLLAKGSHGEVYLGKFNGQAVAIKSLLPGRTSASDLHTMVDEIKLLSRMDNPFIVSFFGVSFLKASVARLSFLVEYMDKGDLRDYLVVTATDSPVLFPWLQKLQTAWSIAQGLVYLHGQGIIHRDLKSRNVLLDSEKGTKLTDFASHDTPPRPSR
ncbi:protein kinase [Achlya hypogyna]|uniref:Protein kinase n=1 Tax=Achlya hypogyna TaxID=1202772 RepID=A0A1V9ZR13_ACHHY|nr:protein kinase [Achlya hypogyna]